MNNLANRAALTILLCAPAVPGWCQEELRVGRVTIHTLNVFSPEEASRGWLYRAADSLRIVTMESVIRKFLLFHEGDPYDPTRLEESERNLRALQFLKAASVVPGLPHDGVIDVEVTTQDSWTTQPGLSYGKKGGVTTYSFSFEEKDLLGTGRSAQISYGRDIDRINRMIEYKDPYLLGPYWSGEFAYFSNSDGTEQDVHIARPFYSFLSPWAANGEVLNLTQNERIFEDGQETSLFSQKHRSLHVEYGRALTRSDARARRLTVGFDGFKDEFQHVRDRPDDVLPDNRNFRYLFARYEDVSNDFIKINYVNRDSRFEDFNLGMSYAVEVGVSPSLFGLDRTTERIRLAASRGLRFSPSSFLQVAATYETRLDSGPQNEILSGSVAYARRFATRILQTLVSHLQFTLGWNLDRDVQFFADGANGLRGYRLHTFEGNKRIIWNVEHRIFSGKEILQLASFGAAVFFDTGSAKLPGQPLKISDFKSDLGVGLRMAISRASVNSIVRVDIAYPINADPFGRKRWLVSFSSGQAF